MTAITYLGIITFSIALGYSWSRFLTAPGEVFDFVASFIYQRISKNEKVNKLLHGCEKCVAGQVCLWIGLLPLLNDTYSPIAHVYSVVMTIFITGLIVENGRK